MITAALAALVVSVIFGVAAPGLGRRLPPALATKVLVGGSLAVAGSTVFVLAVVASTRVELSRSAGRTDRRPEVPAPPPTGSRAPDGDSLDAASHSHGRTARPRRGHRHSTWARFDVSEVRGSKSCSGPRNTLYY